MKKILFLRLEDSQNHQLFDTDKYEITMVNTMDEAIKLIDSGHEFDAAVVAMDRLSELALEISEFFKTNPKTINMPLVIVSHSPVSKREIKKLRIKSEEIMQQPANEKEIIEKLDLLLSMSRKTLLLVDDDPYILDLLKDLFELEEFKVVTASNGETALKLLEKEVVDAVVSDIIMPGISGKELLISVKKGYKNLPVVLITGYGGQCTYEDAISHGADAYLTKPFRNSDLSNTIKNILKIK